MARDKYFEAELQWRALKNKYDSNQAAQRALGWVDLDEPRFIGYKKTLILRSDIANREDAWVFQTIIDRFGTTVTSRKKDFLVYEWKTRKHHVQSAGVREISKSEYESLAPQIKKWFTEETTSLHLWNKKFYCTVPYFFFEEKMSRNYLTRVRVSDNLLEQEEADIKKAMHRNPLFNKFDDFWYGDNWNAPKWYRRHLNRRQKTKAKAAVRKFLIEGEDDGISPNYRDASWYW
jgi:hypothetical protein